jgi:bifunctional UDP-N-acetylglucosamine pyrophosphorylase/glucosamine-1-phosphate N-acetyltransferase
MGQWAGVILAAGVGARMKSRLPKVLHPVCGKEMIRYPFELMRELGIDRIAVVVSPANGPPVKNLLSDSVEYVVQPEARGTGDALARARKFLAGKADNLLVLGGDSPLVRENTVKQLLASHLDSGSTMTVLVGQVPSANDCGRVIRDGSGQVTAIVEAADGNEAPDSSGEINGGVYCFSAPWLWENLERIEPGRNGERYITSLASIGTAAGCEVIGVATEDPSELQGVNNRVQLAQVEGALRQRIRRKWMLDGVTMADPDSVYIDVDVSIGQDTLLLPNTMLLGRCKIGEGCEVGPGSVIRDSTVGSQCRVTASMLEEAIIENGVDIGPFSHLRPGAYLESGVHIGNFAEVKESRLGSGVMMGHFGYVGDASIGANVNLGAGMVTCNYDGKNKHRTMIEAGAFVGCDTMLVAPVKVGAAAVTGAGAVVTDDVPPGRLAVGAPARIRRKKASAD